MKISIIMAAMCMISTGIYAQKISLESGNVNFLKNEKMVTVKFTYDNMKVGVMTEEDYVSKKINEANEKEPGKGDNWYKMWIDDRSKRFEPNFIKYFDKQMSKKGRFNLSENNTNRYLMTVNTHFTEPGFYLGSLWVKNDAHVSMSATIFDTQTNKEIAVIIIDDTKATGAFDVATRIQAAYAIAGKKFAKFLIKKL